MAALISEATWAKAFRNQSPGPFDVAVDVISPQIPSWAGESGTLLSQANIEHGGGRTVKAGPANVGQARLGDTSTNIGNKAKRLNIPRPPAWDRVSWGHPHEARKYEPFDIAWWDRVTVHEPPLLSIRPSYSTKYVHDHGRLDSVHSGRRPSGVRRRSSRKKEGSLSLMVSVDWLIGAGRCMFATHTVGR